MFLVAYNTVNSSKDRDIFDWGSFHFVEFTSSMVFPTEFT